MGTFHIHTIIPGMCGLGISGSESSEKKEEEERRRERRESRRRRRGRWRKEMNEAERSK